MVKSTRRRQQGCDLDSLCYSTGSVKILEEFSAKLPVPGARVVSFIDDITSHSATGALPRHGHYNDSHQMTAGAREKACRGTTGNRRPC